MASHIGVDDPYRLLGEPRDPKWQVFGNGPLDRVVRCTHEVFATLGTVRQEQGDKPEAGRVRVMLSRAARPHQTVVKAYLDGDRHFVSIWMDASDKRLAAAAWTTIKQRCGVR